MFRREKFCSTAISTMKICRTAKSEYIYISDGTEIDLAPHFTFYGYRYVKIEGIPDLKTEDFTGIAYYSNITATGWMKTGNGHG